jgi:general nucleoside transport system permease protein
MERVSAVTEARPAVPESPTVVELPPSRKAPIAFTIGALVALLVFWRGTDTGVDVTFNLSLGDEFITLPDWVLPAKQACLAFTVVTILIAAATWIRRPKGRTTIVAAAVFSVAWLMALLCYAVAGKQISLVGLLQGSLLLAIPLIFGSLSGVLCERSGVVNIAIEGQLLFGAFLAAVVASLTGSVWLGLIAAPVAGLLLGLILATFTIHYFVDQIIVGVVLNVLAVGLTSFLYSQVLAPNQDTWNNPPILDTVKIPVLGDIPIIGPILFNQSILVYMMYAIVAIVQIALFRTKWGLRVRAVGEHPQAADTVGIEVNKVRFRNVLLGSAVAGLGGAYFTIGSVGSFGQEMTAGKGFIALAAMIFGRWSPVGALGAALLFGFADNLQSLLGIIGTPIPSQFMLMAPYLITILAVAGLVGKVRAPAADGIPYRKS